MLGKHLKDLRSIPIICFDCNILICYFFRERKKKTFSPNISIAKENQFPQLRILKSLRKFRFPRKTGIYLHEISRHACIICVRKKKYDMLREIAFTTAQLDIPLWSKRKKKKWRCRALRHKKRGRKKTIRGRGGERKNKGERIDADSHDKAEFCFASCRPNKNPLREYRSGRRNVRYDIHFGMCVRA